MEAKQTKKKADKVYHEMNIRIGARGVSSQAALSSDESVLPLDDIPLKQLEDPVCMQLAKECAFAAICDGYTHLVYNFVRLGSS